MSDELPEGWTATSLGSLVRPSKSKVEPGDAKGRKYVGLEHIESDSNRIVGYADASGVKSTMATFLAGDVLYSKLRPYLNKVAVAPFAGVGSTEILVFEQQPHIDSKFLMHFLSRRDTVQLANERANGVQLPRITFDKIADLDFPLPPLAEQHRIVAKVEELLEEVNRAKARLTKVQAILKRFRQSVLAAACSGGLTREWRDEHPRTACSATLAAALDNLPTRPEAGTPWPELPASWRWTPIEKLLRDESALSYGILKPGDFVHSGVPMIRVMDIDGDGGILREQVLHVEAEVAAPFARTKLEPDDVLITVMATVGRAAVVPLDLRGWNVNRAVAVLRLNHACVRPEYMSLVLRSPYFRAVFEAGKLGTAQARINIGDLRTFTVPIPPLDEQQAIVTAHTSVRRAFARVEEGAASALRRTELLPQAILSKAFSGELVPTEAELARLEGRDYEPASVLLERIKNTAAAEPTKTKKRSTKRQQGVSA